MDNTVIMSAEERAEFEAYKREKALRQEEEAQKQQRADYARLVDEEVASAISQLLELSAQMKLVKKTIYDNFQTILTMKREIMHLTKQEGQFTHTFTNSDSSMRIKLGNRTVDDYRDTVEDGIAMVTEYLQTLAKDEDSADLVDAVMRLLARNKKGVLQPSRVIQLRQLADKRGNARFSEGVRIIEESYKPYASKTFVKAEVKGEEGWEAIPLNITEC
ncbi:DUF3164 family protein [Porphyromonas gingivicanis]|uniref:DUF3164 family protein n=1 Tax=Porphyromonas gingivicanis TaxID=266762 RepID=UPI00046F525A|nr:DUF3164 family protein [Porphyromonas gingivicanis]